ncbi:TetR/AcrR family transcriptional regulator [Acidaminobacter sp. JC074]|uniref:TetR/AcrR family transcriptional regulator n=1 Tax=Acidaminobacter sp. JC074 TaxID=2530199 RepID=UPI001F0F53FA|nr:TetR/AcrR family transcriptional regulator [Acidaminobacter sp. JC074]MCH4888112.1 TetR/AcrR family transcriptional regulator [Acidaminobacter sp. JC074]
MPLKLYEKEKILDACFKLFVENGYSKTSTAMLSEAAGISKALLFHHFKSKKKIYMTLLERCFEKMAIDFEEEPVSSFDDFFEAKEKSGISKITYLRQHPDISRLLYEAYSATPDELRDDMYVFTMEIKKKYGQAEFLKAKRMKALFDEIDLRDDLESDQAYELVEVVNNHFRSLISKELTDMDKLMDDDYWADIFEKKKRFLNMIRYGIEKKGR